ncbi:hypothetical protein [Pseudomonas lundensis]|uniref:hypothetical protein n=1 Tax=Pseudomonas lundensis TaxID=86185 RepID=UPI0014760C08|nr:hypothetical protein [Pseudomonas lundensis]NNA30670.1 hypothetical protein [Pseudomonas lundensis]
MNPVAQRALDRASESAAPALTVPIQAAPPLPELIITGPINRVMELEGRRYAEEVVKSLGSSIRNPLVVAGTIRNLTLNAAAQPSSYASGIKQIIDALRVKS